MAWDERYRTSVNMAAQRLARDETPATVRRVAAGVQYWLDVATEMEAIEARSRLRLIRSAAAGVAVSP